MKKSINIFFAFALLLTAGIFTGCGSTETVTSSFSQGHITVQQTTLGIRLIVEKAADEDIQSVTVTDVGDNGSTANVTFGNALRASFPWPFVEKGKEYTVLAQFFGKDDYSEETVTFKVDNECTSVLKYTEDYLNSHLKLIADGNKRLVKLESTKDKLLSVFPGKTLKTIQGTTLQINVYSGKRSETAPNELVGISKITSTLDDNLLKTLTDDGYDLIANARDFGFTPAKINEEFSKNPKYFASAQVFFSVKNAGVENLEYGTRPIYTNDTVYTPIADEDLPSSSNRKSTLADAK